MLLNLRVMCSLLLVTAYGSFSFAEITATPSTLVFRNISEVKTVTLAADGEAIPATAVSSWRLLVDQRDYSHMVTVKPSEAGVRIQPSGTAEVGSYQLILDADKGDVAVSVFMPLSDLKSSMELLAKRMDISLEEIQRQTGFTQRLGREKIDMNLLPVYYLGQRILIDMPDVENRTSKWKINGAMVQEGADAQRLDYVAASTGPLLVVYEEWNDNVKVAAASGLTEVAREPALYQEIAQNTKITLKAPPGFDAYVWLLDGVQAETGDEYTLLPTNPGEYQIIVKCAEPAPISAYGFREVLYNIRILPE